MDRISVQIVHTKCGGAWTWCTEGAWVVVVLRAMVTALRAASSAHPSRTQLIARCQASGRPLILFGEHRHTHTHTHILIVSRVVQWAPTPQVWRLLSHQFATVSYTHTLSLCLLSRRTSWRRCVRTSLAKRLSPLPFSNQLRSIYWAQCDLVRINWHKKYFDQCSLDWSFRIVLVCSQDDGEV